MSRGSVQKIVNTVIETIHDNLKKLTPPSNSTDIEHAFREPIEAAYKIIQGSSYRLHNDDKELKDKDSGHLYRQLSLLLHPDKLPHSVMEFAITLQSLVAIDKTLYSIPQKILHVCKNSNSNMFTTINSNPTEAITNFLQLLEMHIDGIWKQTDRYNLIIKKIANYFRIGLLGVEAVLFVPVIFIPIFVFSFLKGTIRTWLDLILQQNYDTELEKSVTPSRMAEEAIDFLIEQGVDASSETEMDVIDLYIIHKIKELELKGTDEKNRSVVLNLLKNGIKNKVSGKAHLRAVFNAFKSALTASLPGSLGKNILSILLRFTQGILMIPTLLIDLSIQLTRLMVTALTIGILAIVTLVAVAIIALPNLPLYVYDALNFISTWNGSPTREATATAEAEPKAHAPTSASSYAKIMDNTPPLDQPNTRTIDLESQSVFASPDESISVSIDNPNPIHSIIEAQFCNVNG